MQKSACQPAQFELLRTSQILIRKSEVAPNPKISLFSNEGQLQIIFRRIMYRGPKLEPSLWRSGVFLAGYLSERQTAVDWFSEAYMADFLSLSFKNEHERKKRVKIEPNKICSP